MPGEGGGQTPGIPRASYGGTGKCAFGPCRGGQRRRFVGGRFVGGHFAYSRRRLSAECNPSATLRCCDLAGGKGEQPRARAN